MGLHVPPPLLPPLVLLPPALHVQVVALHVEPGVARHCERAVALQPPPLDDEEEVDVAPDDDEEEDELLVEVPPLSHRQVAEFQWPPLLVQAVDWAASLAQVAPAWHRPFWVQVLLAGQSPVERHCTQRPTPLGGALHLLEVPVHWLATLQKPAASGPQEWVVVLQKSLWAHSELLLQEVPPLRATQCPLVASHMSVAAHCWSVVHAMLPPLLAPTDPLLERRGAHSPLRQLLPAGQSLSALHPLVLEPLQPLTPPKPVTPTANNPAMRTTA